MTLKTFALIAALALPARAADAKKAPVSKARQKFLAGVLAHVDGDDAAAQNLWKQCRAEAAPESDDALDCSLFSEMIEEDRAKSSKEDAPEAVKAYRDGVAAYRRKDHPAADKLWHDCVSAAKAGSRISHNCLAAMELTKAPASRKPAVEERAQNDYLKGLVEYQKGDYEKARLNWKLCVETAPAESRSASDCQAGLERIKTLFAGDAPRSTPTTR